MGVQQCALPRHNYSVASLRSIVPCRHVAATHVYPELTNARSPAATSRSHLLLIHACHWGSPWLSNGLILRNERSAHLLICRYWQLSCFAHSCRLGLRLCRVCFQRSICAFPTTLSLTLRFRCCLCFSMLLLRLLKLIVTYNFSSPQY